MVFRINVSGTSVKSDALAEVMPRAEEAVPAATALSISRLITRPPGPLPTTRERSSPRSSASFRARGEAIVRPPFAALHAACLSFSFLCSRKWSMFR